MTSGQNTAVSIELTKYIAELMLEKRARDIAIMDLRKVTSITDYFLICSADSNIQVKAIVDYFIDALRKDGVKPYHIEGYDGQNWVIVDYIDIVVHIFLPATREYYGIEKLWADAPTTIIASDQ